MNSALAPIVLFTYNRPEQTLQCLKSLKENELADQSTLYIYSDGEKENASAEDLKKIEAVRKILRQEAWCKEVIIKEQTTNKGLANSIIEGVSEIINTHGTVIVLEDDLITSKGFLKFMNASLEKYKNEKKVFQISGYNFPIKKLENSSESFFVPVISSWGWATWSRAWKYFDKKAEGYEKLKNDILLRHKFDLGSCYPYTQMLVTQMEEKKIDSWAIRWYWTLFKNDKLSLFPTRSYISNIGYGENATHTKVKLKFTSEQTLAPDNFLSTYPKEIKSDQKKYKQIKKFIYENYNVKKIFDLNRIFVLVYSALASSIHPKSR